MTASFAVARQEQPRPARLLALLDWLPEPESGCTLIFPAGSSPAEHLDSSDPPVLRDALSLLSDASGRLRDGLFLFWSPGRAYAVRPPLPPPTFRRLDGWQAAPLLDVLGRQYLLGVLLLRRGGYAVGVFQADALLASKSGTRFVKNRHKKGGQSQRRFDRIREKQVQQLFDKVCDVLRQHLQPYEDRLDALFLGGDRQTVQAWLKQCPLPPRLRVSLQPRFLNTPEPRHDTLTLAYDSIWRSDWIELRGAS